MPVTKALGYSNKIDCASVVSHVDKKSCHDLVSTYQKGMLKKLQAGHRSMPGWAIGAGLMKHLFNLDDREIGS